MQRLNSQLTETAHEGHERELLERTAEQDRYAMRELYLLYYPRLARFLRRMTRRQELVDETINDTLLVVWEKAIGFRGDSLVSTWIMGIGYRCGMSLLRKQCRAEKKLGVATTEDQERWGPVAEHSDLFELLDRGMERLSPAQRAVLELTYCLGHSCAETAIIMDCPINTVKTRMFHARAKLRALVPVLAGQRRREAGVCRRA